MVPPNALVQTNAAQCSAITSSTCAATSVPNMVLTPATGQSNSTRAAALRALWNLVGEHTRNRVLALALSLSLTLTLTLTIPHMTLTLPASLAA